MHLHCCWMYQLDMVRGWENVAKSGVSASSIVSANVFIVEPNVSIML